MSDAAEGGQLGLHGACAVGDVARRQGERGSNEGREKGAHANSDSYVRDSEYVQVEL